MQWRLLGVGLDNRSLVILPASVNGACEWPSGEAKSSADGKVITVRVTMRTRNCGVAPAVGFGPRPTTVALPLSEDLHGQRIEGGKGFLGVAPWPAVDRGRYVNVVGLRSAVAREVLSVNKVSITRDGRPTAADAAVVRQLPMPRTEFGVPTARKGFLKYPPRNIELTWAPAG